jgi:hypothetical protein
VNDVYKNCKTADVNDTQHFAKIIVAMSNSHRENVGQFGAVSIPPTGGLLVTVAKVAAGE